MSISYDSQIKQYLTKNSFAVVGLLVLFLALKLRGGEQSRTLYLFLEPGIIFLTVTDDGMHTTPKLKSPLE